MNNRYRSLGEGYIYKIYDGELREYHGEVVIDDRYIDMFSNVTRGRAYFHVLDKNGKKIKTLTCCDISGEVYNGMIWFNSSDKLRAAWILRDYELERIQQLEEEIVRRRKTIDILRKEKDLCLTGAQEN